ncbi:MAG: adenosine deaminase [Bacteroidetes bacterium]|nr:adenosine deaminase [Bacteroidota bacterium]
MLVSFIEAITARNLAAVRTIPKSDLHNHCLMGGRLSHMEKFAGRKIERFRDTGLGIHGVNNWIGNIYRPVIQLPMAFETAVEGAFLQAKSDGVTVLEMSMDSCLPRILNLPVDKIVTTLKHYHQTIAPEIIFFPEVGIARVLPVRLVLSCLEPFLESGYFKSLDLYDDELAQPIQNYREIYHYARSIGLKCKAHVGEFGDAASIRQTVETLGLDAVQHGIRAVESDEVMKWLADNNIQLNISPASNIALKLTRSFKTHPIRILYDHGIRVTVNTDDVILFNKGNSEQFLQLYKSGTFSAEELDVIRKNGLVQNRLI